MQNIIKIYLSYLSYLSHAFYNFDIIFLLFMKGVNMTKNTKNEAIGKIISILNDLNSVNLKDIFKKYEEKHIHIIADALKHNYAFYNSDRNIVTIDKEFITEKRNDDELAYILLHEYFHICEQKTASLSKNNDFKEYADIYAKFVFQQNGKSIPKRFMSKAII